MNMLKKMSKYKMLKKMLDSTMLLCAAPVLVFVHNFKPKLGVA